jgi:glycine/D-amino acid oxidase-like deaminating enzyme
MSRDPSQRGVHRNDHAHWMMRGATITAPVWQHLAPVPAQRPRLAAITSAEIVIVGGGVAGLSTALHLAEAGRDVAVIEAMTVGSGAAGTSAGVVAPHLPRATPSSVRHKLGAGDGDRLLRLVADSGSYMFDLVRAHGIACDAAQDGFIAPTTGRGAATLLERRVREWADIRADLRVADAAETQLLTGCRGYTAALVDMSGGGVDPLALVRGLGLRAERLGVRIYEDSAVIDITPDGDGWRVRTAAGEIAAPNVVLAANGGSIGVHGDLAGTVLPLPVIEVATEPLDSALRQVILPQGHALTDLEPDVFSIRFTADGRLITAFPAGGDDVPDDIAAKVNRRLADMLVTHRPLAIDYAWIGRAWVNASLMPQLVRVADGLLAVQACNGRGLAINTIIGREVARTLMGEPALLPLSSPRPIRGVPFAKQLPRLLLASALAAKRLKRRLRLT